MMQDDEAIWRLGQMAQKLDRLAHEAGYVVQPEKPQIEYLRDLEAIQRGIDRLIRNPAEFPDVEHLGS